MKIAYKKNELVPEVINKILFFQIYVLSEEQ